MKKNKMTVYSEYKITRPQEHYEKLFRDSEDLRRFFEFFGQYAQALKVFLRLLYSGKYDGACKVLLDCVKNSQLYSVYDLQKMYVEIISRADYIDSLLLKELNEELKKKGMVLL